MRSVHVPAPQPVARFEVALDGAASTQAWAAQLARRLRAGDVVILTGELGAGKTTFTQGLGAGLDVREGIISPTFVLSRIHPSREDGPDLVHVDAYRLASAGELSDLDLDTTVDRSVTVVEWGRGLAESLAGWPDDPEASWLDIELVRATGGGTSGGEGVRADAEAGTIITDFSDEDGAGQDEARTAVVLAYGPRWASAALPN
ncbi:tRNA (adenosine(37)-N6)-threonylcarbamoyltransferase complex ATPase subunit type 1 TsaE [Micrococcus sp. TA1]|uniref:tRNA (adenosine(37)-N6)-threonylcarbamoyltransferase complex ATPase subunit type 1 TsaE n=1 Tax=Micrococcus sp. TA1 TaxID=681627 RepID=UPI00161DA1D4|nr:tRNA threonylcarbamoyladenosine biosynthesis protein TsaE [Micrococcus sp. TA1]